MLRSSSRRRNAFPLLSLSRGCALFLGLSLLLVIAAACGGPDGAVENGRPGGENGTAAATTAPDAAAPDAGGLTLAADGFRPGETIAVAYRLEQPAGQGTWVGVIPAEVESTAEADNDAADVTYAYVPEGSASGTLRIGGQAPPGRYRLRLFASDDAGSAMLAETAVFEVRAWSWPEGRGPTLSLSDDQLGSGEELTVRFELPEALPEQAWIAIVPAGVTSREEPDNDSADVAYQYVTGTSGVMRFADLPAGEYVVRLFPCDDPACAAIAEAGPLTVE